MSDESSELKVVDRRRFIQEGDNIKENPEAAQLEAAERQAAEKAAAAESAAAPKAPPAQEPPPAQPQAEAGTQAAKEAPQGPQKSQEQLEQERREAAQRKADQAAAGLPPADFTTVVEFLAQQATMYLGEDPMGRAMQPNLPAASLFIDLLGVLQEKTKGNLSLEESQVLDQILYALRLRYVQRRS